MKPIRCGQTLRCDEIAGRFPNWREASSNVWEDRMPDRKDVIVGVVGLGDMGLGMARTSRARDLIRLV